MNTIESKVYAATLGSGAGTITSGFLLWLLGVTFWHSPSSASDAASAAAAVPSPVAALVTLVLAIGGTFLGGYVAPHTARPDLAPADPTPAPVAEVAPVDAPAVVAPAAVEATTAAVPAVTVLPPDIHQV